MKTFFNPDNFLWKWFGYLGDFFLTSCLWALCCLPLITAIPATVALYDTVAHCVRGKEPNLFRRFFRTFRNELVRGILMTVLWGIVALVLNIGYQVICQMTAGTGMELLNVACFLLLMVPLGVACWAVAIESRFYHSFAQLHRTAGAFAIANLPRTAAITFLLVVTWNLLLNNPFLVLFIPGLTATLQSVFLEPVFAKYMPEEDSET